MNRTTFYNQASVNTASGVPVTEFDFLYNNLSQFVMNYNPTYYRVGEADLLRPDAISFAAYSTVQYWWLIMYVSGIYDPMTELYVGQLLTLPSVLDIFDFYRKWRII